MEKQLLEYVEQESKRGVPPSMIKKALRSAGWDEQSIEEAFAAIESRVAPPLPRPKTPESDEAIIEDDFAADVAEPAKKAKKIPVKVIIIAIFAFIVIGVAAFIVWNYKEPVASLEPLPSVNHSVVSSEDEPGTTASEAELTAIPATTTADDFVATTTDSSGAAPATTTVSATDSGAAVRDAQRMDDMAKLMAAQTTVFAANGKYYTCGLSGGDCGGKPNGYPTQIGDLLAETPKDPAATAQSVCGRDFVYCGLNNASYPQFFCYYAKLEGGGYYTASHAGNFKRSTPPKIFEECAVAN